MFNDDQRSHVAYLAAQAPDKVCPCGWNNAHDCYPCAVAAGAARGVARLPDAGDRDRYRLPDGREVNYSGLTAWLKGVTAPPPDPPGPGAYAGPWERGPRAGAAPCPRCAAPGRGVLRRPWAAPPAAPVVVFWCRTCGHARTSPPAF